MNAARLPLLVIVTLSWIGSVCSADGASAPEKAPPGARSTPYQGGPWHGLGESIGEEGISGPLCSTPQGLAIDRRGRPHVIWDIREDLHSTQVRYAYWDGQSWAALDGSAGPGGISHSKRAGSTRARLAVDRRGRPHVVWINNEDYQSIEYRHWDGRAWQQDRIPWFESETGELALAVDRRNRPHVASIERAEERDSPWPQAVCYRYWDGSRWRRRGGNRSGYVFQVEAGGYLNGICLALDARDRPHLAWGDDKYVYYARWDGRQWADLCDSSHPGGLDRTPERSFTPSLALDRQGRPHVAWREEVAKDRLQIHYRFWDGNRWAERDRSATKDGLSTAGHNAFIPQLAVDSQDYPHVIWCAVPNPQEKAIPERSEVYYKYWDGDRWTEVAGSGRDRGLTRNETRSNWIHLALDRRDRPHVAWGNHAHPAPPCVCYAFLPEPPRSIADVPDLALRVVESTVDAPGVGKQCRGEFVVRNVGPAYEVPPEVVGPSHGVFIYDKQGTLLFRNFGGWSPGLKEGQKVSLRWNTSSNHLGETSEPAFLIPAPGRYRLEIVLYNGRKREQILDVSSKWFTVGKPRAPDKDREAAAELGRWAAAIPPEQLRKHLEASKEELRRRDAGVETTWQISTEALRKSIRVDEALLKVLEGAGNRSDSPTTLQPSNNASGATLHESIRAVPLWDRLDEFDAVVLGTKVKLEAVKEKGDGGSAYYGVLHVKLHEVIKGDKIEAGQTIRVRIPYLEQVARPPHVPGKTLWTSPRKAAIEAVGASHMEPQLRRGLFGLEASPADAPVRYRLLWFNVPDAEDWEPYLEQFRKKARLLHGS